MEVIVESDEAVESVVNVESTARNLEVNVRENSYINYGRSNLFTTRLHETYTTVHTSRFWDVIGAIDANLGTATRSYLYIHDYALLKHVFKVETFNLSVECFTAQFEANIITNSHSTDFVFIKQNVHTLSTIHHNLTDRSRLAYSALILWLHKSIAFRVHSMIDFILTVDEMYPAVYAESIGALSYNAFSFLLHPLAVSFLVFLHESKVIDETDPVFQAFICSYSFIYREVQERLHHNTVDVPDIWRNDALESYYSWHWDYGVSFTTFICSECVDAGQWFRNADAWLRQHQLPSAADFITSISFIECIGKKTTSLGKKITYQRNGSEHGRRGIRI